MSLRHSAEDLGAQPKGCTICRRTFKVSDETLVTICSHRFHRDCLLNWLKSHTTCPRCQTRCYSKDYSNTGVQTRSQTSARINDGSSDASAAAVTTPQLPEGPAQGAASLTPESQNGRQNLISPTTAIDQDEDTRIRNMVGAVIAARQASMIANLDQRIAAIIEQKVESTLASALDRLNLNATPRAVSQDAAPQPAPPMNMSQDNAPRPNRNSANSTPFWVRENAHVNDNFGRQLDQFRFSDISSVPNSGRIAQLIASWDIKFDGSSKLSVDNFLYRIESQVIDTLGGNFNLLCEHVQSLFSKDAKDWYWRYRRSVERVTWPTLCQALRTNFQEHRSDTEIKELIRGRKQGPTESFDDFRNSVLKIAEALQTPLPETELVEVLQRNLRPRIRQQLLYVSVSSLAELRRLCLKGENLLNEIAKSNTAVVAAPNQRPLPRRQLNEVGINTESMEEEDEMFEVDGITKNLGTAKVECWNCREEGHRFFDCLADRSVFCYGCGTPQVYKPNCTKCNPGNSPKSEASNSNPRYDQKRKQ